MSTYDWIQIVVMLGALVALTPVLGRYMARIFGGERTWLSQLAGPLERWTYKLGGVDPNDEMSWSRYAGALLLFNLFGFLVVFGLQMLQQYLPFNPQGLENVSWQNFVSAATGMAVVLGLIRKLQWISRSSCSLPPEADSILTYHQRGHDTKLIAWPGLEDSVTLTGRALRS